MTDREHLAAIRKAARELTDRLNDAASAGLNVECEVKPCSAWCVIPFLKTGWTAITNAWRTTVIDEAAT